MAPDKIYLKGFSGNISQIWSRIKATETSADVQYEYIRKDALLEWAKKRREAVAKEVVIQEGVRLGADAAFEELIDKLNEM